MAAAADKAARTLLRDFNEVENLQVSRKGTNDFVTAADLKAERTLKEELAKARPGFGFLTEESKPVPAKDGDGVFYGHVILLQQNGIYILETMNTGPVLDDGVNDAIAVDGAAPCAVPC